MGLTERERHESVPPHNAEEEVTVADVDLGKDVRVSVQAFKVPLCLNFQK